MIASCGLPPMYRTQDFDPTLTTYATEATPLIAGIDYFERQNGRLPTKQEVESLFPADDSQPKYGVYFKWVTLSAPASILSGENWTGTRRCDTNPTPRAG